MYTTMSNFPYLPHYFLPTSMIIISCVKFFDLSIFTFQCMIVSCQEWFFREISWQWCYHCNSVCAALAPGSPFSPHLHQQKCFWAWV